MVDSTPSHLAIGMNDELFFHTSLRLFFIFAIATLLSLTTTIVPYGRHCPKASSVRLPNRLAWSMMELPALIVSAFVFCMGRHRWEPIPTALILCFLLHYFHRSIVYPLRMRPSPTNTMPLRVAALAFLFNVYNGYLQARSLSHYRAYPAWWGRSPQLVGGCVVFGVGMGINVWSDGVLLCLRKECGGDGYVIPTGGLFEYVTCSNYLGEILEWMGWAAMTWSAAGLAFWLMTFANLLPRASAHHRWYVHNFPGYPKSRRILVPLLY